VIAAAGATVLDAKVSRHGVEVGQDGILRGGWLPPLAGHRRNRPQVS